MIKEFNSLEEIQKYYDKKTGTYIFKEDGEFIDLIIFNFDLELSSNIECKNIIAHEIIAQDIHALDINAQDIKTWNINARDINTWDIDAWDIDARYINAMNINARDIDTWDINAWDINARDIYAEDINSASIVANNISYFAVCFAYESIKCDSIKSRRENAKHFVLDGNIEIKED